ncbi:choline transporter-like protein 2 [Syngnathoides biaculeatus]|uniref:choline transporter-like protein 2 n=1 Tax=Syngnathoides biaculeatus TaxID=300417 RepID=UPI002ADD6808|nr:choline transporter-like protein 2 [Syngnathoides biaculeatus]XP_061685442.1 choline transporter-like protein 2 [Syngnathoides biaculeatus]XP_061685443.1 choline transporter-like protein 2 [Syngnathoides biaculeatus]XP_061685444.1 choline transporter-like protein 2 [Syngnathoides biaculeatus]
MLQFKKRGEVRTFDPNFKGPLDNRGCTDIFCCLLFIIALIGYFGVGVLAWSQGDPRKILYPTDSRGNFCGQKGTPQERKPFLFYFNILKCASPLVLVELQCPTTQICVRKCPHKHLTLDKVKTSREDRIYYQKYCKEKLSLTESTSEIWKRGVCPSMLMPSRAFTRRCLPYLSTQKGGVVMVGNKTLIDTGKGDTVKAKAVLDATQGSNIVLEARHLAMKIFEDYTQSWHYIMIGLLVAMLISWLFIVMLRFLAGIMVWVMIILVLVVVAYGTLHCYLEYKNLMGDPASDVKISELGLQTDISIYLEIRQTWLGFTITLASVEFLIIVLLIFLRKRILIAVALIKESSRAIGYLTSSLFYPLLTFFLLSVVIAYWAVTAVYLATSSKEVYKVSSPTECQKYLLKTCDPKTFNTSSVISECPHAECIFAFYGGETLYHKYLIVFQFYNVFLFFWCTNFVTALGQVTLAGAFASYYWAFKKPDDLPAYPVLSSLRRAIRYHTGSVAFGSLILSIIQIIRVILEYLDHKMQGSQNKYTKFLLNCMKCLFWCLETCIKFLNRNAYIMIAIYGKNFCTSAQDAFMLLLRNIVRVAVLDKVTDFLLLLGKLLIVGIIGVFSFFFFTGRMQSVEYSPPSLNYYWVPILTMTIGAYLIAHGFFSVYAMCVDTLFLCFCEDLERNDGSPGRPYYMSPELHDLIGLANRSEGDGDDADAETQEAAGEEEAHTVEEGGIKLKVQSDVSQWIEEEEPFEENFEDTQKTEENEETDDKDEEQSVSEVMVIEDNDPEVIVVLKQEGIVGAAAPPSEETENEI